jgi:hypothetical protein
MRAEIVPKLVRAFGIGRGEHRPRQRREHRIGADRLAVTVVAEGVHAMAMCRLLAKRR